MALTQRARSNSLRSLASNSSSASGVSLQRSNRTTRKNARSRSRTVTSRDAATPSPSEQLPAVPTVAKERVQSAEEGDASSSSKRDSKSGDSDDEGSIIAYLSNEDPEVPVTPKGSGPDFPVSPTSEAAHRQRTASTAARKMGLTDIDVVRANARDSMTTQQSFTSHQTSGTSYYPPSTTGTADSLLTPSSSSSSFEPHIHEAQEPDTDDVSYRLRLLVNNNYFLPPAHTKPQPSDFPPAHEVQKKSSLPFLDIFKMTKSKSKPSTPITPHPSVENQPPALRTTSDSTSSPAPVRSHAQISTPSPSTSFMDRAPRVVVIKEKMEDIAQAAKKVEEELKLKDVFEKQSQVGVQPFTDVIDPTDAVDLPPPSSEYPFAVQASALHGLGVNESLGAALLAEKLPPSTQNSTPLSRSEDDWRRALLHDAVSLSLHSSNTSGSFSPSRPTTSSGPDILPTSRFTTSPPASIRSVSSSKRAKSPASARARLENRIISNPVIESPSTSLPAAAAQNFSSVSQDPFRGRANTISIQSLSHPLRAETPLTPHTPLAPAPRPPVRHVQTLGPTGMSFSQFDNGNSSQPPLSDNSKSVRKVTSSPVLHDSRESRMTFMMTPPPGEVTRGSFQSHLDSAGQSLYSNDEREGDRTAFYAARPSVTLSMADDHSVSDYSLQSPTASAFFDALSHEKDSSTKSNTGSRSTLGYQTAKTSARFSPVPRSNALSPPPRTSSVSSFRSASPGRHIPSPLALNARQGQSFLSLGSEPSVEILEPEPTTPPLPTPTAEEQNLSTSSAPSPDTSIRRRPSLPIPGPSSPPSFFDTIQSQPNALDDLDSSDDDEGELSSPTPYFRSDSSSPLMRLGNHSTPHVSRPVNIEADPIPSLPRGRLQRRISDSKKPVGFSAPRMPFFAEVKDQFKEMIPPMLPHEQKQPRRPHTSSGATSNRGMSGFEDGNGLDLQYRLKQQRSLKRLDGLLLKHIETEKDTIRRITNTVRTDQTKR